MYSTLEGGPVFFVRLLYLSLTSSNEYRLECFLGIFMEIYSLDCIIFVCGLSLLWNGNKEVTILYSLNSVGIIWFCPQESLEGAHGQWLMRAEGKDCEYLWSLQQQLWSFETRLHDKCAYTIYYKHNTYSSYAPGTGNKIWKWAK